LENSYFNGLPPYTGGKRSLTPWIFGQLNAVVPSTQWAELTFIDAFSGGGAVSQYAKLQGFGQLICNDFSDRSQLILTGLIANAHKRLPLASAYAMALHESDQTFIQDAYGGSTFSMRHAKALDQASGYIGTISAPILRAQLKLLLWRRVLRFVAFGTSIGTSNRPFAEALDGQRSFQELNPKRFQDGSLARLLQPCWTDLDNDVEAINQSIFPALGSVAVHQTDVFELLPTIHGDVLYLDPPYADTVGYGKANAVLDHVLFGTAPEQSLESVFTQRVDAIAELLDVSRHIPIWILSYNDKVVDLAQLSALVQQVEPDRIFQESAKHYAHLPHVAKRDNQELLIIAIKD
jgi:adenine-specific DNA methylase